MQKTYDPKDIEQRLYRHWEAHGWFKPAGQGKPYCIVIPPPNVTGTLHMGHAFQHTLMDALTRLHRMEGDQTLWQPGTDHAGIATQMVVERQLNATGQQRRDLGREAFIERVWEWKAQSGNTICHQERRLGNSVDWSRDRFTMDEGLSQAVTEVFVRLHQEGLIYRGKRLVNWDPVLHTALSDLEVLAEPEQGHLWHFRYPLAEPLADGTTYLVVATTRPETMLGDTAVAVHPRDERYRHLVGKQIRLPLAGRLIPIVADDYVDPAFGSGCVKITPGHDFNDYELGKRHDLPLINILDASANLNDNVPPAYRGLERYEARKRIVADLQALGLLDKIDDHTLQVPRGDRSGAVLEPWLTDQWYVRIGPLAQPAIQAVEDGRIRFVPENWSKTYFQWMHNIQDWCISRQLWWGHQVPAWYDEQGDVYVARSEAEALAQAREKKGLPPEKTVALRRDEDVLDTWFSSALWPFSTLGWPQETTELKTFYPTSVLVTGFDIIFFWVARMIMMGMKFAGDVPFHEVYITGLIRDENGDKMSKSKGNVIDPLDLIDGISLEELIAKRTTGLMQPHLRDKIEKATRKRFPEGIPAYGTDALRFTFCALATMGRDIRFDLGRIDGYRHFCNKLWNAARYVLMNVEDTTGASAAPSIDQQSAGPWSQTPAGESATGRDRDQARTPYQYTLADRWIRSRLGATIQEVRARLADYRFDLAAQALYEFAWYEYCDWYLELSKPMLQSEHAAEAQKQGTRRTLLEVLEAYLRLLHPMMPFITEEIWQAAMPATGERPPTIMLQPYPHITDFPRDEAAERAIAPLKAVILGARQIRGQLDVPRSRRIPLYVLAPTPQDWELIEANALLIRHLANLSDLQAIAHDSVLPPTAMQLIDGYSIHAPLASLIDDPQAELARLAKRKTKALQDLARCEAKLSNPHFAAHAPAHIIEQEHGRVAEFQRDIAQLEEQERRVALLQES
ncbi:valyl-tRNA synthetase [Steroidobacter denitrificans]|uniref:Valine--tRNA ligase n=1 Tax=Steroidobacter denitrificans TaxID=465721 RepID=A0A127F9P6_STEDE|nr:valine--tRNA ligase [Steroidobacter denitrificans]AMN46328.1 valyl-tRNA synthetase [Steroidobacter denitrificans]